MTIGYFGDGRWAHRALDAIVGTPDLQVAFIVARHAHPDPALRRYAGRLGVPFLTDPDVNRPAFIQEIRSHEADLHVSMSFDQILKPDLIQSAPEGFINCHAGALPFYRGRNVLNWALINGEERFGATVHYIDAGIDTGDVIEQRFAEITPDDDYASVLDKAVVLCAEALHEALLRIKDGRVERVPQQSLHPVGFYCSGRREGDEWIDWHWSSARIHNFVRALAAPGPGARTLLGDARLAILRTERIEGAPAYLDRPGSVVGRSARGLVVKTGDTTIRVAEVADLTDGGSLQNKRVPSLRVGTVLGVNPWRALERAQKRIAALEARMEALDT